MSWTHGKRSELAYGQDRTGQSWDQSTSADSRPPLFESFLASFHLRCLGHTHLCYRSLTHATMHRKRCSEGDHNDITPFLTQQNLQKYSMREQAAW